MKNKGFLEGKIMTTTMINEIDAQSEPVNVPQPLWVMEFDRQGLIQWDKSAFATRLHEPKNFLGREGLEILKVQGVRPLNGNVALWLNKNQEQIPNEWMKYRILFMGIVLGIAFGGQMEHNWLCPELEYRYGLWRLDLFNFSANKLLPNQRIVFL